LSWKYEKLEFGFELDLDYYSEFIYWIIILGFHGCCCCMAAPFRFGGYTIPVQRFSYFFFMSDDWEKDFDHVKC
jgi:hypothetical protein